MAILLGAIKGSGFVYQFIINDNNLFIAKNEKNAIKQFHSLKGKKAEIKSIRQVSKLPFFSRD